MYVHTGRNYRGLNPKEKTMKRSRLILGVATLVLLLTALDSQVFAQSDAQLEVRIPFNFTICREQLPAGKYTIAASHLKPGAELFQEVTLREGEQRSIQFEFEVPNSKKPAKRVAQNN